MQMDTQMKAMLEREKAMGQAQGKMAVDTNKAGLENKFMRDEVVLDHEATIQQIKIQVREELRADLKRMAVEAELERKNAESVGHGNNVNQ